MANASYQPKVYRTGGGDELVVASSGKITVESGGSIDLSSATGLISFAAGEIAAADLASSAVTAAKLDATLRHGIIPLSLFSAKFISSTGGEAFTTISAGFITTATSPSLQVVTTTDRSNYINFTSGGALGIQFPSVVIQPDFTTPGAINLKVLAARGSTLDTGGTNPCLTGGLWFNKGDTELSSNTGRITSTAPSTYSVTFSSGDLAGFPGVIAPRLTSVASTNDAVQLWGAWLDYTKLST